MSRALLVAVAVCLVSACGPAGDAPDIEVGAEMSALVAVPPGVACIQITATGASRTVVKSFDVAPGASTATLALRGIPTGNVTLTGAAFAASCASVTPTLDPSWVADPVSVAVPGGGTTPSARMTFRRNGRVDVIGDFVEDGYTTSTIAGQVGVQGSIDGVGAAAQLEGPNSLALSGGALFINDRNIAADGTTVGMTIRKLDLATGQLETIAGSPVERGTADGNGLAARFVLLRAIVPYGADLLIADRCAIRRMTTVPPYTVTTIFGTASSPLNFSCPPVQTLFDIAVHGSDLYLADAAGSVIYRGSLAASPLAIELVAGTPGSPGSDDGTLLGARFNMPAGIAFPSPTSPVFYVSDELTADDGSYSYATIRRVSLSDGTVTTVAGAPQTGSLSVDGIGTAALFNVGRRVVTDGSSLFVGDLYAIRRVDIATLSVVTIAGGNTPGSADGVGTAAQLYAPYGLAIGPGGTLYVADQGNFTIRMVAP